MNALLSSKATYNIAENNKDYKIWTYIDMTFSHMFYG